MVAGGSAGVAGDVYAEFIEGELDNEADRQKAIEQKGMSVITSAGGLVTLLFALGALITKSQAFVLADPARTLIQWSVSLFLAAALLAIGTNSPLFYRQIEIRELARMTRRVTWILDATEAGRRAAEARIGILRAARRQNTIKSVVLAIALLLEAVAVALLAAAIFTVLGSSQTIPTPVATPSPHAT